LAVRRDDGAVLRDFEDSDQASARALVLDGLKERWGAVYDPTVNPDLDDIATNHVDRGAEVVVATVDEALVAIGMLQTEADGRGRILRVSVALEHRREGWGRAIVGELVQRARARRMVEVLVRTDTPWTSATALYEACGFAVVEQDATDTQLVLQL
jgi:ribosomal protein S18 acetylase RimI-like enzyme